MSDQDHILYEFPCHERIRMFLRLELLFRRYEWFCGEDNPFAHHAALSALFDLVDASARSDLKNDLVQELPRLRHALRMKLPLLAGEEREGTEKTLRQTEEALHGINRTLGRSAQYIRENEWLRLVRTRQSLPGGTCEFDLPMLHHWLAQPAAARRAELQAWEDTMTPTRDAIAIVLGMLRSAVQTDGEVTAHGGVHQLPLTGRNVLLARLWLPVGDDLIPEVSANKYMLWIRFSRPDAQRRLHASTEDITFRLALCG